jgi:hypothetical protein
MGGGIKVHSTQRPLNSLLCQPRVIMIMEKSVEWLAGETEILEENLPHCRFVHHKPHIVPVREPRPPRWESSVLPLSYGTAYKQVLLWTDSDEATCFASHACRCNHYFMEFSSVCCLLSQNILSNFLQSILVLLNDRRYVAIPPFYV